MRDHRPQATQDLLAESLPGQIQQRALALADLNQRVLGLLLQHRQIIVASQITETAS
ncbi:hypothetical protein [Veronia nyctiphanis]|uniref:hypothetical protein n=1 Tax=Veronia nyctiphanis TaxID=1278244 RepID=UPI002E261FD9